MERNRQLEAKGHEVLMLNTQLETLREQSARQLIQLKESHEIIRNSLFKQISEMERELAICRAESTSAYKERDEVILA